VPAASNADRFAAARLSLAGPAFAVIGILGFSFKAILIKLAYSWAPIDAVTLLALRMIYSVPFFAFVGAGQDTRRRPNMGGAWILGEPLHRIQLAGAAMVLGGVTLVTMKPAPA
jgi:drug/metabolite transporter (DMT)-like permease